MFYGWQTRDTVWKPHIGTSNWFPQLVSTWYINKFVTINKTCSVYSPTNRHGFERKANMHQYRECMRYVHILWQTFCIFAFPLLKSLETMKAMKHNQCKDWTVPPHLTFHPWLRFLETNAASLHLKQNLGSDCCTICQVHTHAPTKSNPSKNESVELLRAAT